jgi:hypothetical protein
MYTAKGIENSCGEVVKLPSIIKSFWRKRRENPYYAAYA